MTKSTFLFLSSMSVCGAVSSILIEKAVSRFGHTFIQFGTKNSLLLGTIGAVNWLGIFLFSSLLKNIQFFNKNAKYNIISASILCLGTISFLSNQAAKVNLISGGLSFAGALILASATILNLFVNAKTFLYRKNSH